MIKEGMDRIYPDRHDFSLLHTLGLVPSLMDRFLAWLMDAPTAGALGLPANFSIYEGQVIPDQNFEDNRFTPPVPRLEFGCTGEAQTFSGSLADKQLYRPDDFYDNTPPGGRTAGRDMRASLQTAIDRGFRTSLLLGLVNKRKAYFNCYGAGKIDDFEAARIALWINQSEKRAVSVGSWWYWGYNIPSSGVAPLPSFNTDDATLHNWIATGWRTIHGVEYLECIPWLGMLHGNRGLVYISREIYNALMAQPWTGAFTMTKEDGKTPLPIGWKAVVDHLVYYLLNLFKS